MANSQGPRIRKSQDAAKPKKDAGKAKAKRGFLKSGASKASNSKVFSPIKRAIKWLGSKLRFFVPRYFINSWHEIKKVTWPTRRETWRLTGAVFVFAIVFGVLVAGVDKVLDTAFKHLILK